MTLPGSFRRSPTWKRPGTAFSVAVVERQAPVLLPRLPCAVNRPCSCVGQGGTMLEFCDRWRSAAMCLEWLPRPDGSRGRHGEAHQSLPRRRLRHWQTSAQFLTTHMTRRAYQRGEAALCPGALRRLGTLAAELWQSPPRLGPCHPAACLLDRCHRHHLHLHCRSVGYEVLDQQQQQQQQQLRAATGSSLVSRGRCGSARVLRGCWLQQNCGGPRALGCCSPLPLARTNSVHGMLLDWPEGTLSGLRGLGKPARAPMWEVAPPRSNALAPRKAA